MFSQLNEYARKIFIRRIRISIFTHRTERHGLTRFFRGVVAYSAEVYNLNITTDEEFEAYLAECKRPSNYDVSGGTEIPRSSQSFYLYKCQ